MKLTNTTKGDLGLSPDEVVPAGGTLEISNDALTQHKKNPIVKHWLVSGALVESGGSNTSMPTPSKSAKADK